MVSYDAFDPRRASASSAAATPPLSTLATASPFMACAPLAWARPLSSGSHLPAPHHAREMPPPISSVAPVPATTYGAPAQVPYGGPYPPPYVAPSPTPHAPISTAPYEASYGAPYVAPPLLHYGHPQHYRASPSAHALVSYSAPSSYHSQPSAPVADPGPFHAAGYAYRVFLANMPRISLRPSELALGFSLKRKG